MNTITSLWLQSASSEGKAAARGGRKTTERTWRTTAPLRRGVWKGQERSVMILYHESCIENPFKSFTYAFRHSMWHVVCYLSCKGVLKSHITAGAGCWNPPTYSALQCALQAINLQCQDAIESSTGFIVLYVWMVNWRHKPIQPWIYSTFLLTWLSIICHAISQLCLLMMRNMEVSTTVFTF